ncbi:A24 family peptidase [Rhodococcus sp. X156]|uniref:prepilin peptidase n=1 Tax=Rhodococcus sp. X156 TaxID=2499145 RepID=UPI000FDAEE74|nr:A24 family peptidase [Rhodococcus sp. X156]
MIDGVLAFLLVVVAVLGLAVGSFLNVVVHRVPAGDSLVRPASHCPHCAAPIKARHNVPVLSWLALRGRCAGCRGPISARYPLVELLTAALFVAVAWRLAALDQLPALPAYLYFVAAGVALAAIDLEVRRLPNAIVLPSYPVVLGLLVVAAAWQGDWAALLRAVIGCAALFGCYLVLALVHPAGMGLGDVKLAGVVGAVLGYLSFGTLLVGGFAAFLLAAVVGAVIIASRRGSRKTAIPFGPYMITGALLAVLAADEVVRWYLGLVAPA